MRVGVGLGLGVGVGLVHVHLEGARHRRERVVAAEAAHEAVPVRARLGAEAAVGVGLARRSEEEGVAAELGVAQD